MTNGVRVRRDIYRLALWDDAVVWYARAIAEMQKRPLHDPTSWRYQAAIHDYDPEGDPLAQAGDTPPSQAEQETYWRRCQHGTWFFLPWHRMYLTYFERIVAATIVQLNGPTGWALPFWNYSDSDNPDARKIPPAFREKQLPDGSPNPLRVEKRARGGNNGTVIAQARDVDLDGAMGQTWFAGTALGGSAGFGGPETGFQHAGGTAGEVELTPHGTMHVAVGGRAPRAGWMSSFRTAPLDPLFWLHHCNIDRLWSVWRQADPQHINPTQARWLTSLAFDFHDENGNPQRMTCAEVVNTEAPPLHYRYEGLVTPERRPAVEGIIVMERPIPEMVGANQEPVALRGQQTQTRITLASPTGPARRTLESMEREPDVYLSFENVTGKGDPTPYAVYLNLPPGADPRQHEDLFVGLLPMFGVAEASRADRTHSGSGLTYSLNAGKVVQRLKARQSWDPADVRITFVPWSDNEAPRPAVEAMPDPINVGRVSVYLA